jgi:hypothetical protein
VIAEPEVVAGNVTVAARFMALFSGLERAYGKAVVPPGAKTDSRGKVTAVYTTVKGRLTAELWEYHLDGKLGLGVFPLRDDGTVRFGAIDIDEYPHDVRGIYDRCGELGLPLIPCRTKSGGAHWYLFLADDVPAVMVQRKLGNWAKALGYPTSEIFPKQTRLTTGEIGNYLNMPYYGKWSLKYAYAPSGVAMPVEEFLDFAEDSRITAAQLEAWPVLPPAAARGPAAPDPNVATMDEDFAGYEGAGFENVTDDDLWHGKDDEHWKSIAFGLGAGARHNGIRDLTALLFGALEPHLAEVLVRLYAEHQCDPPLRGRELNDIIRWVAKRELAQS